MAEKGTARTRKLSTRLIRKGALLEETHRVFVEWDQTLSFAENLSQARQQNTPAADNQSWLKEVMATLSSRWRDEPLVMPIIELAKQSDVENWRYCLLWYMGRADELYYRFATEWLFNEFQEGAFRLRTVDVVPFVQSIMETRDNGGQGLTSYGTTRAARDLLRMASDFGLLKGSVNREFSSFHLSDESFLFLLHAMYEVHGNGRDVVNSTDWRLFLLGPGDVERELYRLHQFRQLRFEVAGSLMDLTLPFSSAQEYVKEITR